MSQTSAPSRATPGRNLGWLLASFALAFGVWFVATLDQDPVDERIFPNVPILTTGAESLIITEQSREFATVTVRAPRTTLVRLSSDDIVVQARLEDLEPGEHSVELQTSVSRRAIPDTSPRLLYVRLEPLLEKDVLLAVAVTHPPPRGFEIGEGGPQTEGQQAQVSGPQGKVEEVAAALLALNLSQQRSDFSEELTLQPVDANGDIVSGVTLTPATMPVTVPVRTRSDIRQVSVQPVLADTLPEGYTLSSVTYNPQVVLVSGAPAALENAPDTLFTDPVSLAGRSKSFEVETRVSTAAEDLFVFGGQRITVAVGITPLLTSRQFDQVPVEFLGLAEERSATLSPEAVTVLITGARNALEGMSAADLHVLVDLQELEEGSHSVAPDVSLDLDSGDVENISILPAEVDVSIRITEADSEAALTEPAGAA